MSNKLKRKSILLKMIFGKAMGQFANWERIILNELQYNPEITVLKGPANFNLYWRELLLVGNQYDIIF